MQVFVEIEFVKVGIQSIMIKIKSCIASHVIVAIMLVQKNIEKSQGKLQKNTNTKFRGKFKTSDYFYYLTFI